jgi:hypothetical protein
VDNYGHFTWRIKYVFDCFSACVVGIFLKIRTSPLTHMCYKQTNFGCGWSLLKGTLLKGHCVFSVVSWLSIEGILWKFTCHTPLMHWKWSRCDGYQSLTRRTLLEKKKYILWCIWSPIWAIFVKFYPLHSPCMRYKRCKFGSNRSLIKDTLLGEQSSLRLFLAVLWSDFPENSYSPHTHTHTLITSIVIFSIGN